MRRRLVTIAIFLLVGAVVNVAVAWGCAAWLPFGVSQPGVPREYAVQFIRRNLSADPDATEVVDYYRIRRHGALFFRAVRERLGTEDYQPSNPISSPEGMTPEALRPRWLQLKRAPPYDNLGLACRQVFAWGWPLLSLWCDHEFVSVNSLTGPRIYRVHGGIETSLERITLVGYGGPYARVLPILPIWPGFAVNTLFYATLLWLLIYGLTLRRFLRVRRGLCPKCAYPMGESAGCTECGRDLPKASEASNVKRRFLTVAIFLLAGAVVNVAVAWVCSAVVKPATKSIRFVAERLDSPAIRDFWLVREAAGVGVRYVAYTRTYAAAWSTFGLDVEDDLTHHPSWAPWPSDPRPAMNETTLFVAAGWPFEGAVVRAVGLVVTLKCTTQRRSRRTTTKQ